ncbi:exported hypothetical protein [Gammaproteobacteria bacterium]
MKRLLAVTLLVVGLVAANVLAGTPDYVAGRTSGSITFSSSTVQFSIQTVSFSVKGAYAVIKSSIPLTNTASQEIYLDPDSSPAFDTSFNPAISLKGTAKKIQVILQPGATLDYFIQGVKE